MSQPHETILLENAFREFSRASETVVAYYAALEAQTIQLKKEVEEKNRELEMATQYFYNILDSLPVGVVVTDYNSVVFANKNAEKLGAARFVPELAEGDRKDGELKNVKGHYRWKKETLPGMAAGKEIVVFEDVTEMEKMKERFERDERLRAMGEMAARISHEIKNPLGSMELFLSMLVEGRLSRKAKGYVDHVRYGVNTIDRIINNILSFTRPRTVVFRKDSLTTVVRDTLEFMGPAISNRGITVRFSGVASLEMFFDRDLMKLVIMNLVSNAAEAVGQGGLIRVGVKDGGDQVLFTVADNGPGMAEEVRKSIFNPFFTTKDKGVGLGLFIVHNIIHAHGGYIEVESAEGAGSSFIIHLPKGDHENERTCSR